QNVVTGGFSLANHALVDDLGLVETATGWSVKVGHVLIVHHVVLRVDQILIGALGFGNNAERHMRAACSVRSLVESNHHSTGQRSYKGIPHRKESCLSLRLPAWRAWAERLTC